MKVVMLDRETFAANIHFAHQRIPNCQWVEYPQSSPETVPERIADAEVIVTNKVKITAALQAGASRLRLIAAAATGVDNIDVEAARARQLAVCNVRGYAVNSVPEHVFSLLFALRRNLLAYHAAACDGRWSRSAFFCLHSFPIEDLAGSTLGVIGSGTLGEAVARMGQALGMRVLFSERRGVAPHAGRVAFEEVLRSSDAITLHVPLTPHTRGLIGANELATMKPTAMLVNTARGGVVDEAALLAALRAGQIAGAATDVLAVEPPPPDHPLLTAGLPNLLVTPHVAWASRQAQQKLADEVIENIAAFQRGEQRNRVV